MHLVAGWWLVVSVLIGAWSDCLGITQSEEIKSLTLQEEAYRLNRNRIQESQQALEAEKRQRPRVRIEAPLLDVTPSDREDLPSFWINTVHIDGMDQIWIGCLDSLIKEYSGRYLNQSDISLLLKRLTNRYLEKGYITTYATLPTQNLSSGVLKINVLEGKISRIEFSDTVTDKHYPKRLISTAFPKHAGEVLNLRDLDQGIEQLNRTGSSVSRMRLIPDPNRQGFTIVEIDRESTSPYQGRLHYFYGESIPIFPNQIALNRDNILSINDTWSLNLSQDNRDGSGQSRSLSLNGSIPFGYLTFSGGASQFNYSNVVSGNTTLFLSSGSTVSSYAGASSVVYRSSRHKLEAGTQLTIQETESFIQDVRLDSASQRLAALSFNVSAEHRGRLGYWSSDIRFVQGLDAFGATRDKPEETAAGFPKAQYQKWVIGITGFSGVYVGNTRLSLQTRGNVQHSVDSLYGNEQVSIGDEYSVRGFNGTSGNSGGFIRQDITCPLFGVGPGFLKSTAQKMGLNLNVGIDSGLLWADGSTIWKLGSGIGLSGNSGAVNWSVIWGIPITSQEAESTKEGRIYARAAFRVI